MKRILSGLLCLLLSLGMLSGCSAKAEQFRGTVVVIDGGTTTETFTVRADDGTERDFVWDLELALTAASGVDLGDGWLRTGMEVTVSYGAQDTAAAPVALSIRVTYAPAMEEALAAKPVLYLYPSEPTEVTVRLDYAGRLTTTWPAYDAGWTVTAAPDGTLTDATGCEYSYLFWEGVSDTDYDMSRGFVVAGAETAEFLRESLAALGLTPREYNEFIVYWLPQMEGNAWNLISFQDTAYTDSARLEITPAPDSLLRVFMAWQPLEAPIDIEPQTLTAFVRTGFTAVEWGGARVG